MNFPKWLCGLYISPNDIKKEPPLERLTTVCHMIYFLWKNMCLWQALRPRLRVLQVEMKIKPSGKFASKKPSCPSVSKAQVFTNKLNLTEKQECDCCKMQLLTTKKCFSLHSDLYKAAFTYLTWWQKSCATFTNTT